MKRNVKGYVAIDSEDKFIHFTKVKYGDSFYGNAGWIRHFPAEITFEIPPKH